MGERPGCILTELPHQYFEALVAVNEIIESLLIVNIDEPTGTMDPVTKIEVAKSIIHAAAAKNR